MARTLCKTRFMGIKSRTWKAAATSQRNSSLQAGPSSVTPKGSAGDALPVDSRCRRRASAQGSGSAGACSPSTADDKAVLSALCVLKTGAEASAHSLMGRYHWQWQQCGQWVVDHLRGRVLCKTRCSMQHASVPAAQRVW